MCPSYYLENKEAKDKNHYNPKSSSQSAMTISSCFSMALRLIQMFMIQLWMKSISVCFIWNSLNMWRNTRAIVRWSLTKLLTTVWHHISMVHFMRQRLLTWKSGLIYQISYLLHHHLQIFRHRHRVSALIFAFRLSKLLISILII